MTQFILWLCSRWTISHLTDYLLRSTTYHHGRKQDSEQHNHALRVYKLLSLHCSPKWQHLNCLLFVLIYKKINILKWKKNLPEAINPPILEIAMQVIKSSWAVKKCWECGSFKSPVTIEHPAMRTYSLAFGCKKTELSTLPLKPIAWSNSQRPAGACYWPALCGIIWAWEAGTCGASWTGSYYSSCIIFYLKFI